MPQEVSQAMIVGSVCVSAEELEVGGRARILGMEVCTEAEFLDEIHTKFLRVFLHAFHSHLSSFALRLCLGNLKETASS